MSTSGATSVKISCPSGGSCAGTLTLQTARRRDRTQEAAKKKVLTLASSSLLARRRKQVRGPPSQPSAARSLLSHSHGVLRAKLTILSRGMGGQRNNVTTHVVTLRRQPTRSALTLDLAGARLFGRARRSVAARLALRRPEADDALSVRWSAEFRQDCTCQLLLDAVNICFWRAQNRNARALRAARSLMAGDSYPRPRTGHPRWKWNPTGGSQAMRFVSMRRALPAGIAAAAAVALGVPGVASAKRAENGRARTVLGRCQDRIRGLDLPSSGRFLLDRCEQRQRQRRTQNGLQLQHLQTRLRRGKPGQPCKTGSLLQPGKRLQPRERQLPENLG